MRWVCRAVFWIYLLLAAAAIALIPLSDHSLLGLEPDALAGVFALLLSLPWSMLIFDLAGEMSQGQSLLIIGGCVALNAGLLRLACRLFRR